jgi:hypothetical protein
MSPANNGILSATDLHDAQDSTAATDQALRMGNRTNPVPAPTIELQRSLADIKGQAQFLLYLADQIDESLEQLTHESDRCHSAFLCKVLAMYSSQLETKNQGLGEKIAEACQEVYVTIREHELA